MKANDELGYRALDEEYLGDAGNSERAMISIGKHETRPNDYRAECGICSDDTENATEYVRDRVAGRGPTPNTALEALACIAHGWPAGRERGFKRALAEARDETDRGNARLIVADQDLLMQALLSLDESHRCLRGLVKDNAIRYRSHQPLVTEEFLNYVLERARAVLAFADKRAEA